MIVYLRVLKILRRNSVGTELGIFEGNVKQDRKYWKKHHNTEARYFELKEVEDGTSEWSPGI